MKLSIKRIYEPPEKTDGMRILVDRIWPRGVSKQDAHLDHWEKELAPSTDLRKWFGHDPEKWPEFRRRYRDELKDRREEISALRKRVGTAPATLLFAAHDEAHNNAVVLCEILKEN